MSVTKYLACKTCKKRLWIGQSYTLYTGDKHLAALREFLLYNHESVQHCEEHELICFTEHTAFDPPYDDFEEVSA